MSQKLYILVRKDLSLAQRCVQSCHAVAEFMSRHGSRQDVKDWVQYHKTMVVLIAKNRDQIEWWDTVCQAKEIPVAVFYESDLNNEPTALAALPNENGVFRDMKLDNGE